MKVAVKTNVFTILLYTLWIVLNRFQSFDYSLTHFNERQIGVATLEAFDVGARLRLFYGSLLIFVGVFFVFLFLTYFLFLNAPAILKSAESRLINYLSLGGLLLLLFKLYDIEVYESQELIYAGHKLLLLGLLLRFTLFKKSNPSVGTYLTIFVLSFALYFLVIDLNDVAGYTINPDFYIVASIIAITLMVSLNLIWRNKTAVIQTEFENTWAFILFPLLSLPFISILKDEIYLVLKVHGYRNISIAIIYLVLIMFVAMWIFLRAQKSKQQRTLKKELLATRYFPMIIFSLTAFAAYACSVEYYDEIFESGNVYLPLMEYKLFGVLAPLEKLNTHLLSDYFFGAIYTFFNGLKISEVDLYDFLLFPISYTLFYYLIYYLSGNALLSFFAVFVFPFAEAMMPTGYCLGILALFALNKLILGKQSLRRYHFYFTMLLFLILWRIDLAYVSFVAMPLLLLYYHFREPAFKIEGKLFWKSLLLVFGSTFLLLIVLSAYRGIDVFEKLNYFLHYCGSAQSYGYNTVGWSNLPGYKMHYFVFPVLLAFLFIVLLLNHQKLNVNKRTAKAFLALMFILLFYFLNFNRGLIRHSLIEWTDTFTSSFVYIVVGVLPFVFLPKWQHAYKSFAFGILTFFAVENYRVPDTKGLQSQFEKLIIKLKTTKHIDLANLKSRVKNKPADAGIKYYPFIDFINKACDTNETFIDFSNKGMLYYYTQKETPSWFYQNPLCVQDDYLQKQFIKDLKKYHTPFLLFNELNNEGYDFVDQVPNTLRHYRMAEYFYAHFEPAVILGSFCVWKEKTRALVNRQDTLVYLNNNKDTLQTNTMLFWSLPTKKNKKYYAKVVFKKGQENTQANFICDSRDTGYVNPPKVYRLSPYTCYALFDFSKTQHRVGLNNARRSIDTLIIVEADYIPDYLYQRSCSYHFRKLPAVWGKYDAGIVDEKIVWQSAKKESMITDTLTFNLPNNLDKLTGNNLLITAVNEGKVPAKIRLILSNAGKPQQTDVDFEVLPGIPAQRYAIRISSFYQWYRGVDQIKVIADPVGKIKMGEIQISKAN